MRAKRSRLGWATVAFSVIAAFVATVVAPPASAAVGECPPGYGPIGPGDAPDFFDQNVSVFAGGNFSVGETAAEAEGVLVTLGDASFQRTSPGLYNVGVVGQGSGVPPNPGTNMLVVGGTMSGNPQTTVQVGFGIGGNVVVGGPIAVGTVVNTGGPPAGTITQNVGPAATAPYGDLPAKISAKSAEVAALPTTGTVATTGFSQTFTGDGTSNPQVFTITGAPGPARTLQFKNIPDGAAVYINVTATVAELEYNTLLDENGAAMPTNSPEFPPIATHTLWNFPGATNVSLDGFAELPGSILVPNPASTVVNSMPGTNGRIYVNGNLSHIGTGSEMHNYPFVPSDELNCLALLGGFTVHKVVVGDPGGLTAGTVFTGTFTCESAGTDVTPVDDTWSTTAGADPAVVATGLPVGSVCNLVETAPDPPDGDHQWQPAVISPSSVTIADDGSLVGFTVTNTLTELTGGFTVSKVVAPVGAVPDGTVFSGTYSCVDGAAAPQTGTWSTSVAGPAQVVSGITLGSVCTLTEDPPAAPDGNHVWEPVVFSPSNPFTVSDAVTPVAVTATNTLVELGGFTIDKVVDAPAGAVVDPSQVFSGTYSCTLAGANDVTGTWSTTAGGAPFAVSGVAVGSSCTLSETAPTSAPPGYVWEPAVFSPSNPFTVSDAVTPVAVTATNTLTGGGFTIDKVVDAPAGAVVDPGQVFSGTYSCTLAGANDVTGTWSTTAGGAPFAVSGVAVGSSCTLSETAPTSAPPGYVWEPAVFSPSNPFTVSDAVTPVAVTATNTLTGGGFTIDKVVDAPAGAVVDPGQVFSGTYSCTLAGANDVTGTWSTTAGGAPFAVSGVAVGSSCTLSETAPTSAPPGYVWEPAVFSPSNPFTVSDAVTPVAVTATNTLTGGGFTIDKVVDAPAGAVVDPGQVFSGTYSCTLAGANDVTGTWSTTAGGAPFAVSGVAVGSSCTLSETAPTSAPPGYVWEPAVFSPSNPFTVSDAVTPVAVTATNTLTGGGFTIDKVVDAPAGAVVDPGQVFSGTYSCTLAGANDVTGTWSTTAGGAPFAVTGVAVGSSCTLTEDEPAALDGNHVWEPAVFSPASPFTVSDAATPVAVTATNTLVELTGGFTVSKVVAPVGAVPDGTVFSGTWSCVDGAAAPQTGTWSTSVAGPVQVVSGITLGSSCTLTEDPPAAPDGNHVWEPAVFSPASPFTVSDATVPVAVTATNTLTQLPGGFTVAKVVNDPDGVVNASTVYSGTFTCTLDGTDVTPTPNTWSTTAGAPPAIVTTDVPLGSVCTLSETPPVSPDGNHVWQPAQISPASVTISNANTSVGFTVTNTLVELTGGFTVSKVVAPVGAVPDDTVFTGTWSCVDGVAAPQTGTWSTSVAGPVQVVSGITLGSVCTLAEDPPAAPDGNHVWQPAEISPASVTISNANTSVGFTVTNTLVELTGGFTVSKVVAPVGAVPDGTVFTGTWSCVDGVAAPQTGTWSTSVAGPVQVVSGITLGSSCTLTEDPPAAPDGNHVWEPAVFSPASPFTVSDATVPVAVTATNTLTQLPGGFTVAKVVNDPDGVVNASTVYSGTFTCTLDGTDVTPTPNTWSTTAGAPPAIVTTDVPLGSVCTLSETPPVSPDGNHVWQPAEISPASVTISNANTSVGFTVTNTLVELTGGFTVSKVVAPVGAVPDDTVFTGTWSCVDGVAAPQTGTWSTSVAGPVQVVSGITLGSVCTLAEDPPAAPDGNHVWQPAQISPASVTISNANTSVGFTVTNTLVELTGGFTVSKVVAPVGAVPDDTVFTGTWSCVDGVAAPQTGTWSTSVAGPVQVVSGITLGSSCTLTEDPPAAPDGNHVWEPAVFSPASPFTVSDATVPVAVTATNTLTQLPGGFTVAKVVNDPDGVVNASTVYSGTFTCTLDGTDVTPTPNTWSTTAGAPPAIVTTDVPLGSVCTLSETPPVSPDGNHVWQPAEISPASVTISNANTSVGFTVTNTLVELTGGFTVSKVVAPVGAVPDDTVFTGTWSCVDGVAAPQTGTWSTSVAGPVQVVSGITLGSVCTLAEDPPAAPDGNHVWQPAQISPASVTISNANTSVGFTVTNTLVELTGGFTVSKVVAPVGAVPDDTVFTGTWSCVDGVAAPQTGTWSTSVAGPVQVVSGITLGSSCTLTEDPPAAPDGNHVWEPAVFSPASPFTVSDATVPVAVTATNTLTQLPGGFTVAKVVNDPDGVVNASTVYSGTFTCTLDGTDVTPTPNTWSTTAGAPPAIVTTDVPLGSVCTLSETPPVSPDGNHVWQPAEISPASVTISNANTSVGFTVTNTLVELTGGFTVSKVVAPVGAVPDDTVFTGTWSCVDGVAAPQTGTWSTSVAGPVQVVSGITLGSVCTLAEDPPAAPDGNHVWQPAEISPASVTISNANTSVGFTVTNTLVELTGGFTVSKVVAPVGAVPDDTVFTGTWSCVDGVAAPQTGTWSTSVAGPVQVVSGITLGSSCTLTEDPPAAPDGNHVWEPAVFSPASPFTVSDATVPVAVTATNTLTQLPGGFTVAKVVNDPDGVVNASTVYSGTFTCTLDGTDVTPTPNTWSTTAGAPPAIVTTDVPLGSVCTLSETPPVSPDGNHVWQPAEISPASVTISNANTSVGFTVTNTLVELTGGFTVSKVVAPVGAVPDDTVFTGTWSCVDGVAAPQTGTWSTSVAGPVQVVSGITLGSVCTLAEDPPAAPDGNHVWQPAEISPASVTISNANTSVGFTVTNTLVELTGGFTVSKTVNAPAGAVDPSTAYSGTFTCTLNGDDVTPTPNTWSTTAGAAPVVVTSDVPLGSVCTLVETPPTAPDGNHLWQPAQITPTSVTISDANTSVGFTVTNTLTELPGGFTVAKVVEAPPGVVDAAAVYSGTFTCTLNGADVTPVPNTWSTTAGAAPAVVTTQVPLGSVCTLSETPPAAPGVNFGWNPAVISPASVTITDATSSVGFTVTNTLVEVGSQLTGGFTVAKVVDAPPGVVDAAAVYAGTFSCTLDGTDVTPADGTWSTTAGGGPVVVSDQIPLGSVCTLAETPPVAPDGNHVWQPAVIAPASVTISAPDRSVGFTVTNTLTELPGGFTVGKIVVAPAGEVDASTVYSGTFTCTLNGDDVTPVPNTWSTTAGAPPVVVTDQVPLGSVCTLVETPPAAPDGSHVWQPAAISPASVTVTNADTSVGFTVTNTLAAVLSTSTDTTLPVLGIQSPTTTTAPAANVDVAQLAVTGPWSVLDWLAWLGLVFLLGGMALAVLERRKHRRHS